MYERTMSRAASVNLDQVLPSAQPCSLDSARAGVAAVSVHRNPPPLFFATHPFGSTPTIACPATLQVEADILRCEQFLQDSRFSAPSGAHSCWHYVLAQRS